MKNPSMMRILVMILAAAAPLATANEGLLDATITDSFCAAGHKNMRTGADELCVRSCVRNGAKYVMWDGRNAYVLSDQKAAEPWAGRKVRVLATLDAKTMEVHVVSIVAR
ncbi:MAG TPA: hypothetical protein VGE89_08745 [Bryobacteraceae bacterium]|jgi:hypothetical protein